MFSVFMKNICLQTDKVYCGKYIHVQMDIQLYVELPRQSTVGFAKRIWYAVLTALKMCL
jgi:hypothetical protein